MFYIVGFLLFLLMVVACYKIPLMIADMDSLPPVLRVGLIAIILGAILLVFVWLEFINFLILA